MALADNQKWEIARKFVDNPKLEHSSDKGISYYHLCRFKNSDGDCHIEFKFTERDPPGLCIYFEKGKEKYKKQFEKWSSNGFEYIAEKTSDKDAGYLHFRNTCTTQEEAYKQIVNPGEQVESWKRFYTTLQDMLKTTMGVEPTLYPSGDSNQHGDNDYDIEPNTSKVELGNLLSRNLIFFGAPGTGKSFKLKEAVEGKKNKDGSIFQNKEKRIGLFVDVKDGKVNHRRYERVTFYPTYSYAQFVGCYKPVMNGTDIAYEFVPGPFLRVFVDSLKALKDYPTDKTDHSHDHCLVIEEINRANAAAVFGDVFQLLDRGSDGESEYDIAASEDVRLYLKKELDDNQAATSFLKVKKNEKGDWTECRLRIPSNMYIWATMNSADQGVFPMDTAFKRRWKFKYFEINQSDDKIVGRKIGTDLTIDGKSVYTESNWTDPMKKWNDVRKFINRILSLFKVNEDKLMGPWFVQPESEDEISAEQFESKVLMYLWEDAARMCRQKMFPDSVTNYSELITEWRERGVGIFARLMENDQVGRKDSVASGLWDKELGMAPKS